MSHSLNVRDFTTVQEAIDKCPYGGKLYFPGDESAGPYRPPTKDGWTINKPIEIYGDSRVHEGVGLGYFVDPVRGTADSTILRLKQGANHFYLHDICLSAPAPWPIQKGEGCGIRFDDPGSVIWGCTIERVGILYAGKHGMNFAPTDTSTATGYFVAPTFSNISVYGSMDHGIVLRNTTAISFDHVYTTQNRGTGFVAHSINGAIKAMTSEGNGYDLTDVSSQASCLYIEDSAALSITGMHLEDFSHSVVKTAMVMKNVRGSSISGNLFEAPGERGLFMQNCHGNVIGANSHFGLKTSVELDNQCTGNTIFPQYSEPWGADQPNAVIIPKNQYNLSFPNIGPNENKSSGITLPEINGTSAIKNPKNGTVIYDQNAGRLKYYHNGSWKTVRIS